MTKQPPSGTIITAAALPQLAVQLGSKRPLPPTSNNPPLTSGGVPIITATAIGSYKHVPHQEQQQQHQMQLQQHTGHGSGGKYSKIVTPAGGQES